MQLLVEHLTHIVLAYGTFPVAQPGADVVDVDDALLQVLTQTGSKTLKPDGTISVDTTAAAAAQLLATQQAAAIAAQRAAAVTLAQSAVGLNITALTANQQRALLACLLYRAGAVDANLVILPLGQWL
jgi:hypothetical protein